MADAKRYVMTNRGTPGDANMEEAPLVGGWVKYEDFAALEQDAENARALCDHAGGELQRTRETLTRLREAIVELADDCEQNVKNEYGWPDVHPAVRPKFDRDMAWIAERRALTEGEKCGNS